MLGFLFFLPQLKLSFLLRQQLLTRERFVLLFVCLALALERLLCLCADTGGEHRA